MQVKVFKLGGASVKDAPAIENLYHILRLYPDETLVVVISAMGKTTNFLERVLEAYHQRPEEVPALVDELQRRHEQVAEQLVPDPGSIVDSIRQLFQQLRERLTCPPSQNYDFDYDQIVSFGELLSTTLISGYLNIAGIPNTWMDARRMIRTDSTFREGRVDWEISARQIQDAVAAGFGKGRVVLTQGFIGGTAENLTTTLGREGSDFSAAIIAHSLDAESVTIWKDVPGLLNADPKRFSDAVKLDRIPYEEALELTFYGASVIHPKTLKPLQNKQIPLFVKSFFHPESEGSVITNCSLSKGVPSFIVKDNQVLLSLFPKDFSFMGVENLSDVFTQLAHYRVKINMMQNSALSLSIFTDNVGERLKKCVDALKKRYKVKYNDPVQLITIRHYTPESVEKAVGDKKVLMRQTSRATIQFVVK